MGAWYGKENFINKMRNFTQHSSFYYAYIIVKDKNIKYNPFGS